MPDPAILRRRTFLVLKLFLSPFGRIGRGPYWLGLLALSLVGLAVSAGFGMLVLPKGNPLGAINLAIVAWTTVVLHTPGPGLGIGCSPGEGCRHYGSIVGLEIALLFCFSAFCLQAKRLHDAGHTAVWVVVFALFEFLAPFGLGLLTKALFKPEDLNGFVFAVGAGMAVGMIPPALFKLWIGLAKQVPDANEHGARPGKWDVTWPAGPRFGLLRPRP